MQGLRSRDKLGALSHVILWETVPGAVLGAADMDEEGLSPSDTSAVYQTVRSPLQEACRSGVVQDCFTTGALPALSVT